MKDKPGEGNNVLSTSQSVGEDQVWTQHPAVMQVNTSTKASQIPKETPYWNLGDLFRA